MLRIFYSLLLIFLFTSCKKESSKEQETNLSSGTSLPIKDTALIGDTTIFFDVVIDGQRELQIQPLNNYSVYWTGILPYVAGTY
jgi:hypothetical protein